MYYTDKTIYDLTENERNELLRILIDDIVMFNDDDLIHEIKSDVVNYGLLEYD